MKEKSRQNKNGQRNNMIESKQISSEVTRARHCFTIWEFICVMHLYWNVFQ